MTLTDDLLALERVCDKRHERIMNRGLTEAQAAESVVTYLDGWMQRQENPWKQVFAKALKEGYQA